MQILAILFWRVFAYLALSSTSGPGNGHQFMRCAGTFPKEWCVSGTFRVGDRWLWVLAATALLSVMITAATWASTRQNKWGNIRALVATHGDRMVALAEISCIALVLSFMGFTFNMFWTGVRGLDGVYIAKSVVIEGRDIDLAIEESHNERGEFLNTLIVDERGRAIAASATLSPSCISHKKGDVNLWFNDNNTGEYMLGSHW